ncbi:MAG: response regulator transcription factor [Nitrospira sp.]
MSDDRTMQPDGSAEGDGVTKGRLIVQVLLVDDHAMVRQGLRSVLESYDDIQVIGEAQNGSEAVSLVQALRPHVVVMDINMPKMNGIEATARIKTQWPQTIVVGISVNAEDDNRHAMMRAGAARLLTKEQAVEHLHDAIVQEVRDTDLPPHR